MSPSVAASASGSLEGRAWPGPVRARSPSLTLGFSGRDVATAGWRSAQSVVGGRSSSPRPGELQECSSGNPMDDSASHLVHSAEASLARAVRHSRAPRRLPGRDRAAGALVWRRSARPTGAGAVALALRGVTRSRPEDTDSHAQRWDARAGLPAQGDRIEHLERREAPAENFHDARLLPLGIPQEHAALAQEL